MTNLEPIDPRTCEFKTYPPGYNKDEIIHPNHPHYDLYREAQENIRVGEHVLSPGDNHYEAYLEEQKNPETKDFRKNMREWVRDRKKRSPIILLDDLKEKILKMEQENTLLRANNKSFLVEISCLRERIKELEMKNG